MLIAVEKVDIEERISKNTGKPYLNQIVRCQLNNEVRNMKVYISTKEEAFPIGKYTIAESSYKINEWGQLEIGFLNLEKAS